VLDFYIYWWHRASHEIPFLWRFHRMHHSDAKMDVSTALRFHPGEVLMSGFARLPIFILIGAEAWQLLVYESVFQSVVLFHHSNVRVPRWLDYGLLAITVTPAMHRVHHSREHVETDSNYGSVFPYWDMLFRTWRLRPDAGELRIGLDHWDNESVQTVRGMLTTPLKESQEP
jgi:sterol desaturase/sphingolipid hydroxylase (fatty acid hydroxylase superfamily)